jgi:hypothetical protein
MENRIVIGTPSERRSNGPYLLRIIRLCCAVLLLLMAVIPAMGQGQTQQQVNPRGGEPTPELAAPAILAAFDKYEVVGMPAAHGMKDIDDFILALIRSKQLKVR